MKKLTTEAIERKRWEEARDIATELYRMLNSSTNLHKLMKHTASLLKEWSGCEAVGIRLRDGYDFPYFETNGFPDEHIRKENRLCAVGQNGQLVRDSEGNPVLQCMCGNIICGRFDPSKPFFTEHGSFWSNCTTDLLASTTEEDRQARTRNTCNGEGYESVALIPLRSGSEPFGLIQFNDSRKDMFTMEKVEMFERMADSISSVLAQRRAEKALQKSEASLAEAQRIVHVGNWDWDIVTNELYWSDEIYRIFGLTPQEFGATYEAFLNSVHPDDRDLVVELVNKALEGETYSIDHRVVLPTGEVRTVHEQGEVTFEEDGKPIRMVGTVEDITERKRAEEALIRTNRALRMVSECNQALIREQDEIQLLDAICKIIVDFGGYRLAWVGLAEHDRKKTVRPVSWMDYEKGYVETLKITWADTKRGRGPTGTAIRTGELVIARDILNDPAFAPWRKEALERRYASLIALPLKIADQAIGALNIYSPEPDAFIGEEVDLLRQLGDDLAYGIMALRAQAEHKQVEEALAEKTMYLDNILRGSTEYAIATTDLNFRITYYNPMAEKLHGYKAEEVIGKTIQEMHIKEKVAPERLEHGVEKVRRHGEYRYSIVKETKEGPRYFDVKITGIYDINGELVGYANFARDVTEQKELESEILRTQKLESLGVLAGGLAHDFNNFLMGINLKVSTARLKAGQNKELRNLLQSAEDAVMRAKGITQQLLTFTRGGEPITNKMELVPLLKEAVKFALHGTSVKPHFNLPKGLRPVEIDPDQINQVINNLVINAVHAMPKGGEVTTSVANVVVDEKQPRGPLKPGHYVEVSIQDTGVGIPPNILDSIFDPYFSTREEGSGLGLFSCYNILDKHEGWITVESVVDQGSTFTFYLPAQVDVIDDITIAEEIISGRGYLLVVDDEKDIRTGMAGLLESLDYEVDTAPDGKTALETYHRQWETDHPFDLVILDLTLPGGMSGVDIFHRLREINPEVKAVVSSGYATNPIIARYADFGFKGVVIKPFSAEELSMVLSRVLGAE